MKVDLNQTIVNRVGNYRKEVESVKTSFNRLLLIIVALRVLGDGVVDSFISIVLTLYMVCLVAGSIIDFLKDYR